VRGPSASRALLGLALLFLGCGPDRSTPVDKESVAATEEGNRPGLAAADAGDRQKESALPRIVFLGDSLTAGLGLEEEEAFPARLGHLLAERQIRVEVINAGVSGDTSAGGRRRIDWILRQRPDVVVVGLGANDGLRGLSVEMTEDNLRRILEKIRAAGARGVLVGMKLPPNMGPDYVEPFEAIYPRVAAETGVTWVPFLLEGVAGVPELNLPDGIHPNAAGHQRLAQNVLPAIEEALSHRHTGDVEPEPRVEAPEPAVLER
jgi:acyl-CoA thioesterase-1